MALASFADGVDAVASQVTQFYDLLTGVMTDQSVTLKNTLALGGSQSTNDPVLVINGVAAQTADFIRVVPNGGVTPSWSINKDGLMVYDQEALVKQIGTPSAPAAGYTAFYSKVDGRIYFRPSAGSETALVSPDSTDTFTNKTLTAPVINAATITGAVTVADGMVLTTPTIADFTKATHNHSSAAQGGTGVGEIEACSTTLTVGGANCTTTTATIPSCSKLLSVFINGLRKSGATRTNTTTIAFNETRVAGDEVVVLYVAS